MQACPDRSLNYLFTNDELSLHVGPPPPPPRFSSFSRARPSLSVQYLQYLSLFSLFLFLLLILGQGRFLRERWRRVPWDSNLEKWIRNNKGIGLCKDRINICFPRFREKRIIRWTAHREFRPRLRRKLYPWRTEGNLGGGWRMERMVRLMEKWNLIWGV